MTRISNLVIISAAAAGLAVAQTNVAPTTGEQVGASRGQDMGTYNVTNSFEVGYRFGSVGGNDSLFRSDVNYGNGLRLLGSSLTMDSKDGRGKLFDELLLNTMGLGNDPYESVMLRIRKNRLYRYDMMWRENQFYDAGVAMSGGEHLFNTTRLLQDHDLTLLPDNRVVTFELGYSRNTITGPGLTSAQEVDTSGTAFPFYSNIREQWNDYRAGATLHFAGFTFMVRRTWEFFKEDNVDSLTSPETSTAAGDPTKVQTFSRTQPFHGSEGSWLGTLFTSRKHWAANARATYASSSGNFALNEMATGTSRFGAAGNREILVSGAASRPALAGDFNFSVFPTEKLSIVNHTAVSSIRIDGNNSYTEFDFGTNSPTILNFQYLGVRTVSNATDLHYNVRKWFGAYAGYTFSDRQITVAQAFSEPSAPNVAGHSSFPQESALNAVRVGFRLQPLHAWTINLEGEVGHVDGALTPISDRNYHTAGARTQYRTKKIQLGATYREMYNENAPLSFSSYSSKSRQTGASASWTVNKWLSFDASYTKLHLDTVGSLQFFAGLTTPQLQTGFDSVFISNIHSANAGLRVALGKRADVFVGYSLTKDTGDGRSTAAPAGSTGTAALLDSVQTFPLTYESPMARVSVKITPKIRWNAAYQYYGYNEQFQLLSYYENYHALTGYTSLLWSF